MEEHPLITLRRAFGSVADPRVARTREHELLDVFTIAICAVICGADSWTDMELFGNAKRAWLGRFLLLPNGIPSHDTFSRVFARIDPAQFQACFLAWVQTLVARSDGQVVAVDGKTLRHSGDTTGGHAPIHMVSAWATDNHVVLGQLKVNAKSNEITAVPALLRLLDLTDCIVTVDALNCQTATASQIVAQDADYVLALKGNHPRLYAEVVTTFTDARATHFRDVAHGTTIQTEKGHGRIETRQAWLITDPAYLQYLDSRGVWPQLRAIGMVEAERQIGTTLSRATRYYLVSFTDVAQFAHAVRAHWGIENQLHWTLDVAFAEDASRVRADHSAENFAVLRHIALNLLKQHPAKLSIKSKRHKAGWDDTFLYTVLVN
ncbi:MAG: ISAs1 family transposase [Roseiflexaceae bacterium]|nr:ISAs1 family transposase [Roseiflexaceae bacterium]